MTAAMDTTTNMFQTLQRMSDQRRADQEMTRRMFQEISLGQAPAVTHTHNAQLTTPGYADALTNEVRCQEMRRREPLSQEIPAANRAGAFANVCTLE